MSFLSLLAAFMLEQLRPLAYRQWVAGPVVRVAAWLERRFNAGQTVHGVLAWCFVTVPVLALLAILAWLLSGVGAPAALLLNVAVLYLCMGFRTSADSYADIQLALRLGEVAHARRLLAAWRGDSVAEVADADLPRLAIETALLAAHRRVFAVVFWFVLLPGPLGAALYRLADLLAGAWRLDESSRFATFPQHLFRILDWLPQRATALAFAVVGNFEDALYSWRGRDASQDATAGAGVLASASGALGIQLGPSWSTVVMETAESSGMAVGKPADVDSMQSAVGLLWRAAVLWISLLFLLGLAGLAG